MKRLIMYSRTCFIMIMNAMCHSLLWKKKNKPVETKVSRLLHRYFIRNLISYIQLKYMMQNLRLEKYMHKAICFCCVQQGYDGFMWSCSRHPLLHSPPWCQFYGTDGREITNTLIPKSQPSLSIFHWSGVQLLKGTEQEKEK